MLGSLVGAVRRNHGLEHGTVSILLSRLGPNLRLVGRAVPDGFYIYGKVPTDAIESSAGEALLRLQARRGGAGGDAALRHEPGRGRRPGGSGLDGHAGQGQEAERLPGVFSAAMLGVLVSQPVGRARAEVRDHLAGPRRHRDHRRQRACRRPGAQSRDSQNRALTPRPGSSVDRATVF